jgi:hypothetical protein
MAKGGTDRQTRFLHEQGGEQEKGSALKLEQ